MADVKALRELLAEEFGITSDAELAKALGRMGKINIGSMADTFKGKEKSNGAVVQKSA